MAITRPTGEQLRFLSAKTGEHVLDTYLESTEKGTRTLPDLMGDLFDDSGVFRSANFELRFDESTDTIQFRAGNFSNSSVGWIDITTFFKLTGTFSSSTTYNNFDLITLSTKDVYIVHGLSSGTTFSDEAAVIASANTDKLVDVSEARDWASKTDGQVVSTDYSSKAYAVGGTGIDTTTGSAKDWAIKTSSTVGNTGEYSAKYWATSTAVTTVSSGIANINTVAAAIASVNTTAANISNVNTVAGISADVTTVANIDGNVSTVAGISANTTTVAGIAANVTTVAGVATNVTTVSGIASNVTTVANNNTNVTTVATNVADVNTVAGEINNNNLQTVANDIQAVITLADDLNEATSEIDTVANSITNVDAVGNDIANVNSVATNIANVNTSATNIANVNTVAGISANVTTVAGISADVTTAATNNANITTVAGISSNVTTVAGISANVTTVANISADVTTAASNVTAFNNTYLGAQSSAPTQDPDGSALDVGDLYFDTTSNTMKVYAASGWTAAGSSVNGTSDRQTYTATAGQTVFAASYDAGYVDVYLNGVKLLAGTDFTATNGSSITLASGAAVNDIIDIVAYGTFVLADHLTQTQSDARYVNLSGDTMTGGLNITSGNLGIGTSSASELISVEGVVGANADAPYLALSAGRPTDRYSAIGLNRGGTSNQVGLSFYTTNNLDTPTEKMRIDSSGNVKISNGTLQIERSGSSPLLQFTDTGVNSRWMGLVDGTSNFTIYGTNGSTQELTLDSSGNVLVGQSSTTQPGVGNTTTGFGIRNDGLFFASAYQGRTGTFGRNGNDGPVLGIYKDGANAGDFGAKLASGQSRLYLGNSNTKLLFDNGADRIYPVNNDGNARNAAIDLGLNGAAFKDLYLSGTANVGGLNVTTSGDPDVLIRNSSTGSCSLTLRRNANDDAWTDWTFKNESGKLSFISDDTVQANADRLSIDYAGNLIFNEDSLDSDFRVESNNNAHMFFVNAGADTVHIGSNTGPAVLNVDSSGRGVIGLNVVNTDSGNDVNTLFNLTNNADQDLQVKISEVGASTKATYIGPSTNTNLILTGASVGILNKDLALSSTAIVVNQDSRNMDFRVESDNASHMLFVDAGADKVGINESNPAALLHLTGTENVDNCEIYMMENDTYGAYIKYDGLGNRGILGGLSPGQNEVMSWARGGTDVTFNDAGNNMDFRVEGNNVSNGIVYDADDETVCFFTNTTSSSLPSGINFKRDGQNNGWQNIGHTTAAGDGFSYIQFLYNSSRIGQAVQSGTTGVTYQTTSDYRLKENAVAITSATERVKQLNPIRFNFISEPDRTIDGFLAHEVQAIVPEAVSGTKDEVDDNGNPEYQGLDTSRLVPVLVATIKELEARITALENS